MIAVVYNQYGAPNVLKIVDRPIPQISENEILVQVKATSVTTADMRLRSLKLPLGFSFLGRIIFGFTGPRKQILGTELSGVVCKVGKKVRKFKVGDEVIVIEGANLGCYVEYKKLSEDAIVAKKPSSLSFEQAATIGFGFSAALSYLTQKTQIKNGDEILVNGASGSVGSAVIQIAKLYGAKVTAICSERNFEYVRSLGADICLDYSDENLLQRLESYDKIVDIVGNMNHLSALKKVKQEGQLLLVAANLVQMISASILPLISSKRIVCGPVFESLENLNQILSLVEAGKITPTIDSVYTIQEIVRAHEFVDKRNRKGNVAIVFNAS